MKSRMTAQKFKQEDINTRFFDHQYNDQGPVMGGLAVIHELPDGYCLVGQFSALGISLPLITAWSGCLEPRDLMKPEEQALAQEARKIGDCAKGGMIPRKKAA